LKPFNSSFLHIIQHINSTLFSNNFSTFNILSTPNYSTIVNGLRTEFRSPPIFYALVSPISSRCVVVAYKKRKRCCVVVVVSSVQSDSLVTLNFESHPLKFLIATCHSSKEKLEEMEGKEMEGIWTQS
jgi:hypothetical protein